MAMSALAAWRKMGEASADKRFLAGKLAMARFYADNILVQAEGLATQIIRGGQPVLGLAADAF